MKKTTYNKLILKIILITLTFSLTIAFVYTHYMKKEAIEKLPTSDDREIFWRSALSDDVMELVRAKKYDEAEASIRDAISGFRA